MGQTHRSGVEASLVKRCRRTRVGEPRWREWIEAHRRSGLSVAAFCAQHGVSTSSFYAWRRRLRARTSSGQQTSQGEGHFVRVEATNPLADRVEVVLPNGVVVRASVSCLEQVMRLVDRDASC